MSRSQFSRLAASWRKHRQARLLVAGRRGPATRAYGIDPRADAIAGEVIRDAGAAAELATVAPLVEELCREAGVDPPSRPTLWNRIREARRSGSASSGPPRIALGRLWFNLPTLGAGREAMTTALIGLMLPERRVVAHLSSTDTAPSDPGELVAAVVAATTPGAPPRPLLMDADDRRVAADALDRLGLSAIRTHPRSVQREVGRAFGGRLGALDVLTRRGLARPDGGPAGRGRTEAIALGEAARAIDEAVASHNAALVDQTGAFTISAT